jgi:glucosamine 6-phosphate synthetase-like amidotransferase/phosphosugar isomerase protein
MCGIAGILISPKSSLFSDGLDKIRNLSTSLLIGCSNRGWDASGICTMDDDGDIKIYKKPVPVRDFVNRKFYTKFVEENINTKTRCVLLHARAQTKGSKWVNGNNHPVAFDNWVVVHNGIISNDEKLFEGKNIEKPVDVDTVAIPMVIETLVEEMKEPIPQFVVMCMKKIIDEEVLKGSFAFAAISPLFKDNLFLVRDYTPIWYSLVPKEDIFAFASSKDIVNQAIVKSGITSINSEVHSSDVHINSVYRIHIEKETIEIKKAEAQKQYMYGGMV